ncbi:protein phosphatase 1 regulatory subunit 35-like isoform X1 [Seriola lalandi dorsalis]|uniref:protein phosphatase 1 regulatory subunit 35-like isoform X1 n=1 Tax=Seriola lalandi dorsalis TaxID=1841481 RepID=UPI000C6F62C6|nr:protein phosphatase 1 regulatory subunit 35-like isoform X1 [Seriola lalandi dorsalis]XP_023262857.1 protein phosphatase 1 regulatory subunit 35-like isoform X1 [Seriola lalandi dorsalis]XP_023262858.1 protein phosphatase 1 regulatory subunit 35-like isoform X1 [Seriola lalandi dorsalis]XP_056256767.1 protein phosphatase 1 regulatory subunit 35 isoform X1 [Seriola aureovittata]
MSSSSFPSPPPSPHPAPLPFASSSSSLTGCPELDLSVTFSFTPKTSQTQLKPCLQGQTRRKRDTQLCFVEPVVVKVTPEPDVPMSRDAPLQQPIRGQRRSRGCHHVGGAPRQSVEPAAAASNQDVGCLGRAELNTTLALKAELQSLQGVEFNPDRAVQETLQRSERTKNLINSRATEVVNVSRSQLLFTSLVSVEVQKDQLISQILQDRRPLAMRPRCHDSKAMDGPSPFLFMSSDLLRQKPLPPEEVLVNYKPHPLPRPTLSSFDLYKRQIRWEATP